jgi:uncharacterized protein YcsI (UPF0317 family)
VKESKLEIMDKYATSIEILDFDKSIVLSSDRVVYFAVVLYVLVIQDVRRRHICTFCADINLYLYDHMSNLPSNRRRSYHGQIPLSMKKIPTQSFFGLACIQELFACAHGSPSPTQDPSCSRDLCKPDPTYPC